MPVTMRLTCIPTMILSALALTACGDSTASDCEAGAPGCACLVGTCQAGLSCIEGLCLYPGGTDGGTTEGSGPPSDSSGQPPGGAGPEVLSLVAGDGGLFEGSDILISATVSDPDGVEDVQGGALSVQDGSLLADFLPLGAGTWQLVLPWEVLDAAHPIVNGSLILRADFVDAAGNMGSAEVSIVACASGLTTCPIASEGGALACVDLQADEDHCGSCGEDCSTYYECVEGNCENVAGTTYGVDADDPAPDELDGIAAAPYDLPVNEGEITLSLSSTESASDGGFPELSDAVRDAFNLSLPR